MTPYAASIVLVVDDNEANRYALSRVLRKSGFKVTEAGFGRDALRLAEGRPDLIVLDVNLPDIDGFEVLKRLKAEPGTAGIPVLQMSASFVRGRDRAMGLDAGADGYLVQPVEPAEFIATVRALLRAKSAEDALRRVNVELEERVRERTAELEARNAELETFVYTVSHDLRSPLLAIQGMGELIGEAIRSGDHDEIDFLLGRVNANVAKMGHLLNDLLKLSRVGRTDEDVQELPLGDAVDRAVQELAGRAAARGARIDVSGGWPRVRYHATELDQVLVNLIGNALKWAGRDGAAPLVSVRWDRREGRVAVRVEDNGPGIAPRHRERVWELFVRLNPASEGTGVGLAIVKRIVERHGGRVWVEDSSLGGAAFVVTLPAA